MNSFRRLKITMKPKKKKLVNIFNKKLFIWPMHMVILCHITERKIGKRKSSGMAIYTTWIINLPIQNLYRWYQLESQLTFIYLYSKLFQYHTNKKHFREYDFLPIWTYMPIYQLFSICQALDSSVLNKLTELLKQPGSTCNAALC